MSGHTCFLPAHPSQPWPPRPLAPHPEAGGGPGLPARSPPSGTTVVSGPSYIVYYPELPPNPRPHPCNSLPSCTQAQSHAPASGWLSLLPLCVAHRLCTAAPRTPGPSPHHGRSLQATGAACSEGAGRQRLMVPSDRSSFSGFGGTPDLMRRCQQLRSPGPMQTILPSTTFTVYQERPSFGKEDVSPRWSP